MLAKLAQELLRQLWSDIVSAALGSPALRRTKLKASSLYHGHVGSLRRTFLPSQLWRSTPALLLKVDMSRERGLAGGGAAESCCRASRAALPRALLGRVRLCRQASMLVLWS